MWNGLLIRNNRIKSIHSSLKIEANSLSLGEVRDVISGKTFSYITAFTENGIKNEEVKEAKKR